MKTCCTRIKSGGLLLSIFLQFALGLAPAATLTTCDEPSLRSAINGGGTVTFACDGVITLTSTLAITANTTLDASGRQVTISGNNAVRVFDISSPSLELVLVNLTVANGRANNAYGGGMINRGWIQATRCTFVGNQATGAGTYAGAILNFGRLTLNQCAFISNSAGASGGAIGETTYAGPILATNCTFFGNTAPNGAALYTTTSLSVTDQLAHCTVSGNIGTGLFNPGNTQPPRLISSILSDNSAGNCAGSFLDGGHNISSDASFNFNGPGSRINLDPLLAPLGMWGGPTLTCALIEGSPAIDMADTAACPPVDQRGTTRPVGAGCDIGAFEGAVPIQGVVQFAAATSGGNEASLAITIHVARTGDLNTSGDVSIATSDGTALAGTDYVATNAVLHFGPGETSVPFVVTLLDDAAREIPETLHVTLSNATDGIWLGRRITAALTIDDDEATVISDCTGAAVTSALGQGGTIRFNCDGIIAPGTGLGVVVDTYLDGAGRNVTLDGLQTSRVLAVPAGVNCFVTGLKIINGGGVADGAGMRNLGTLTVRGCVFSNNVVSASSGTGGAISSTGTLNVYDCTFVTNRVSGSGSYGGAIYSSSATLRVHGCAFINNASGGSGGAIASFGAVGNIIRTGITNSTFYGNVSPQGGGSGIYNGANSTSIQGSLYIVNCTLSHNGSTTVWTPIPVISSLTWVANSIVANCQVPATFAFDAGNNILWNGSAAKVDPFLAAPALNGGATPTMALLPESPALNQVNNLACPPVDQRGQARPFGPASDIGAFESTAAPSPVMIQFSAATYQATEFDTTATVTATRTGNTGPTVTIDFAISGGTAISGQDYTPTNGTLTFGFGQATATFAVSLHEDTLIDGARTLNLVLANPTGGAVLGAVASATLTIMDDETLLTDCSEPALRTALSLGGTVTVACDGIIPLTSPLVLVRDAVLDASGRHLTISGGGSVRPFTINSGVRFLMTEVTVANGFGSSQAGGLLNSGVTRLVGCVFSNNVASGQFAFGGAIYHGAGWLTIEGCLFDNNRAEGIMVGSGGAVSGGYSFPSSGLMEIVNSTFTRNSAMSGGGAIAIQCVNAGMNGPTSISYCTFAGNTNGAIFNCAQRSTMTVSSSILSDNHGPNAAGPIGGDHNLSSDQTPDAASHRSLYGTDPKLGPLANNGGPTWTMALQPDSPALDAASFEEVPPADQRGAARPFGRACDIGAFEAHPAPSDVRFAQAQFSVMENGGTATITVIRDDGNQAQGTVQFSAVAGTATAGSDFTVTSGQLVFPPGATAQTFQVSLVNDDTIEGVETIRLILSGPTGGVTLGLGTQATLFLIDDDAQVLSNCDEAALRAALVLGGHISFDCDGILSLTEPLVVNKPTILDAAGHDVVLSGNSQTRVFHVLPGVAFTLVGTTVRDGWHQGPEGPPGGSGLPGFGGGLYNEGGDVQLIECTFESNRVMGGTGGIEATMQDNALHGGPARGGAIHGAGGTLHATQCTFANNWATGGSGRSSAALFPVTNGGLAQGGALTLRNTTVELSGCTLRDNRAVGGAAGMTQGSNSGASGASTGGALFLAGSATEIIESLFENNIATSELPPGPLTGAGGKASGGAIFHESGTMRIDQTQLRSNHALGGSARRYSSSGAGWGGGIFNQGTLGVTQCRALGNTARGGVGGNGASAYGGALFNANACSIAESLFESNSAVAGPNYRGGAGVLTANGLPNGGAIANFGTLNLEASTLAKNSAIGAAGGFAGFSGPVSGTAAFGGGLYNGGTVQAINNTFFQNECLGGVFPFSGSPGASSSRGGDAWGGAVFNIAGSLDLMHQTFAGNVARGGAGPTPGMSFGGGICNSNGQVTLLNSVLAHGTSGDNGYGAISDAGYNLSSDASCAFSAQGSLNETDPVLGPLDDYGGATPTVPLLAGSPAIDAADPAALVTSDQRGRLRPFGAHSDIGAFESSAPYTMRGVLLGYVPAPIAVGTETASVLSDAQGRYQFNGLAPGTYTVRPGDADIVFVPHAKDIAVGPDVVGVDFNAYRTNAITLEMVGDQAHYTYAGSANESLQVDFSIYLLQWQTHHPAQTTADGIHQWIEQPRTNPLPRFYRTQTP